MILAKTDKGRASLSDRRTLSPRERQLMVLADGKRQKVELAGLLGFDIDATVARLVFDGYLTRVATASKGDVEAGDAGPIEPPAGAARKPERAPDTGLAAAPRPPARPAAEATASAAVKPRRSLAAAKMYMIGLMQMLRDPEASMLAVSLHGAQNADELRHWVVRCMVFIHGRSGPDYAARVAERVLEVFPQDDLPALCDDLVLTQLPAIGALAMAQRRALPA